jgi:hypothetical protein
MAWRPFRQKVRTSVETRQGYLDRPVLLVLLVSLAAAVLILGWLIALYMR